MPAIDLARLRKQAARLADFFFLPDEFLKHLHEMLDFYVNRTLRTRQAVAPASVLRTYRTPTVILRQIENEISQIAAQNPQEALDLADRLWDEGYLETRLLAAFLLGRIPPQEERLLARLTAWTQQVRDPSVRAALLTNSLARMRKETPDQLLVLVSEWLQPERTRLWSNGIQTLIPLIAEPDFHNLPPVFEIVRPILETAPSVLQNDLAELILALHEASPTETAFFLRQVLTESQNPMTAVTMRRISARFPAELLASVRDLIRAVPRSTRKGG